MALRAIAVAVVLAWVGTPTSAAQCASKDFESGSGTHTAAQRVQETGLPNFAVVTPQLYRGGQPTEVGFQTLKKMGVDIVVDLRLTKKGWEKKQADKLGIQYVSIPWHCDFPEDHVFAQFLALLRENPRKKVYVHCRYGDDRTGMAIAAYRMAVQGWTPGEARKEMQKFGFHRFLCPSLGPYEKSFPKRLKEDPELSGTAPAQNASASR